MTFKRDTKDDLICTFISHPCINRNPTYPSLGHILRRFTQESYSLVELAQVIVPEGVVTEVIVPKGIVPEGVVP